MQILQKIEEIINVKNQIQRSKISLFFNTLKKSFNLNHPVYAFAKTSKKILKFNFFEKKLFLFEKKKCKYLQFDDDLTEKKC